MFSDRYARLSGREWRPHPESNQELLLRREPLYPFNYGDALKVRIVPVLSPM